MFEDGTATKICSELRASRLETLEDQLSSAIILHKQLVGLSEKHDGKNAKQVTALTKRLEEIHIAEGTLEERRHGLEEEITRRQQILGKEKCSQWCSNYHQRLPREIRDMIYQYMLSMGCVKDVISSLESSERYGPTPVPFHIKRYQYLDHDVVSRLFLTELLTTMYNCTKWRLKNPAHIHIFLERSPFEEIGFPLAEVQPWVLVRQLVVLLPCAKSRDDYVGHLEPLKFLECKTAVELVIKFANWDRRGPSRILPLLEEIAPWIFKMKSRGFDLKVTTTINGWLVDFMEYIGESADNFQKWQLSWPKRACCHGIRGFILRLAEEQSKRLKRPQVTEDQSPVLEIRRPLQ